MPIPAIKKRQNNRTRATAVLVAGGAGFIGTHLVKALLQLKHKVIIIDNFATGREASLASWIKDPQLKLINHDLTLPLKERLGKIDQVYHLVSQEAYLYRDKKATLRGLLTNSLATKQLLDIAARNQAKFLLASSLEVYRGLLSPQTLDYYFGAVPEDTVRFSHAEAKRYAEALTWEYFQEKEVNARICRLGEVYGPGMNNKATGQLGRLIEELKEKKSLTIVGEGLDKEYYTHVYDVILGLIQAMNSPGTEGKIFPLSSLEPITTLELAYLLKALIDHEAKIVYKNIPEKVDLPDLRIAGEETLKTIGWKPKISLTKGLTPLLQSLQLTTPRNAGPEVDKYIKEVNSLLQKKAAIRQPTASVKTPVPAREKQTKQPEAMPEPNPLPKEENPPREGIIKNLKHKLSGKKIAITKVLPFFAVVVTLIIGILVYPSVITKYRLGRTVKHLVEARTLLLNLEQKQAYSQAKQAEQQASKLQKIATSKGVFVFRKEERDTIKQIATTMFYNAKTFQDLAEISSPLNQILNRLTGYPQTVEPQKLTYIYESLSRNLSLASSHWYQLDPDTDYYQTVTASLPFLKTDYQTAQQSLPLIKDLALQLPYLLGENQTQNYLLLIRDSHQITPQGGKATTLGVITIKNGSISQIVVDDFENIWGEKQFSQTVTAEDQMAQIKKAWQDKTKRQAAGVISLSTNSLTSLLELTGPLYIPTYNETLTSENVQERLVYRSQKANNPGKKNLTTEMAQQLLQALLKTSPEEHAQLVKILFNLLEQHQLSTQIPAISTGLSSLDWDGSWSRREGYDIIAVLDHNITSTKADYFIKRYTNYQVRRKQNSKSVATIIVNYTHTGQTNAWPGGKYQNRFQIVIPQGSQLIEARISSSSIEGGRKIITSELEISEDLKNTMILTGEFELNARETIQLIISYQLPDDIDLDNYQLKVIKPWGTNPEPISVRVEGTELWKGSLEKNLLISSNEKSKI